MKPSGALNCIEACGEAFATPTNPVGLYLMITEEWNCLLDKATMISQSHGITRTFIEEALDKAGSLYEGKDKGKAVCRFHALYLLAFASGLSFVFNAYMRKRYRSHSPVLFKPYTESIGSQVSNELDEISSRTDSRRRSSSSFAVSVSDCFGRFDVDAMSLETEAASERLRDSLCSLIAASR